MAVSINRAWDETQAFLKRERRLVVPILATFVVLPTIAFRLFMPEFGSPEGMSSGAILLLYGVLFVEAVGGITLILLATGASGPLGQTIGVALRRALRVGAAFLLFCLLIMPVMILFAVLAAPGGGLPTNPAQVPPQFLAAVMAGVFVAMLLFTRVSLFVPAATVERLGPWAALKRGWQLGRGITAKLIATFLFLFVASMVVSMAVQWVFGAIAQLGLGGDVGLTPGSLLVAIAVGLVAAVFLAIQAVMAARIYAQAASAGGVSVPDVDRAG